MVLPVSEVALVSVRIGLEDSVALEFAVKELALEFVAILKFDLAVSVLEIVVKLSLIEVLSYFLELAFALEAMASKFSLVNLLAAG